ncbi:MAG: restriction endonuclease [Polaromonas sp.]|nr:restriction endonuclease [Polaromonas sp.]
MKFKMAEKSLFAILLRSPWWISFAIALGLALAAKALLPAQYVVIGALSGLPFAVIGVIAAYRQLSAPSTTHAADTLAQIGAMSWRDFSAALAQAFARDGYEVQRLDDAAADFALIKTGRTTLLSCKRWKAARLGVAPFQSLEAARSTRQADAGLCITTGQVTDKARQFAATHPIRVMQGAELAQFLAPVRGVKKKA